MTAMHPSPTGVKDVPRRASKKLAKTALLLAAVSLLTLRLPAWVYVPVFFTALVVGILALRRTKHRPSEHAGAGFAWAGLGLLALPIAGALLVLALRHYLDVSGEEGPIGDMRAMNSAMVTYAALNGGLYAGRLSCLSQPTDCLQGYAPEAPKFLGEDITGKDTRRGYRFRFHAGGAAAKAQIEETGASETSVTAWAYTAVPVESQERGARQFCVDSSNLLCSMPAESEMTVVDGRCPASCKSF